MIGITHLIGLTMAVCAALSLAIQVVFVRMGTDKGRATDAVLIVTFINLTILIPLVLLLYYPEYGVTLTSLAAFVAAGFCGTLLGRLLKYTSIERIGASRTAPIVSSNVMFGAIIAIIVLGEALTVFHGIGIIAIVAGVAFISWETSRQSNASRRASMLAIAIPFGAAIAYGAEPTLATIGLDEGTPVLVGLLIKTSAAFIGFYAYLRYNNNLPKRDVLRSKSMRWFLLAGVANTSFIVFFYSSLAVAPVVVVYPLIPTNTLFVIVLSALFLPQRLERVTWRLFTAATVVVVGVILITIFS